MKGTIPPVRKTFRILSLPESFWKALASGAWTAYTTHWPYVGELAELSVGKGVSTTDWYALVMAEPSEEVFRVAMSRREERARVALDGTDSILTAKSS